MDREQIVKYCIFLVIRAGEFCSKEVTGFIALGSREGDKSSAEIRKRAAMKEEEERRILGRTRPQAAGDHITMGRMRLGTDLRCGASHV